MSSTDYEGSVHRRYSRGRALNSELYDLWMRAFANYLSPMRPLRGLDLGSGTGRFTPHLADAFGPADARVYPCGACSTWFGPGATTIGLHPSDGLVVDLRDRAVRPPDVQEVWAASVMP